MGLLLRDLLSTGELLCVAVHALGAVCMAGAVHQQWRYNVGCGLILPSGPPLQLRVASGVATAASGTRASAPSV